MSPLQLAEGQLIAAGRGWAMVLGPDLGLVEYLAAEYPNLQRPDGWQQPFQYQPMSYLEKADFQIQPGF